ncbi:hypothetical protein GCM10026983_35140 [Gracilibacillus alcaliphilus]
MIKLGSNTLITAIPTPIKVVPMNKRIIDGVERIQIPINKMIKPYSNAFSLLVLFASLGAKGDMKPKARSGRLVRNPAAPFVIPRSSRIMPIIGPTPVMAGRRLKANKIIPITLKIVRYRLFTLLIVCMIFT